CPPAFSCSDSGCNFHIHQSCIDLPLQIHNRFHPQNPLSWTTNNYLCIPYWQMPSGEVYRCHRCDFQIDIKCAIANTKASGLRWTTGNEFRHFSHPHNPSTRAKQRNQSLPKPYVIVAKMTVESFSITVPCVNSTFISLAYNPSNTNTHSPNIGIGHSLFVEHVDIRTKYAAYGCYNYKYKYKCDYFVHLGCGRNQRLDFNLSMNALDSANDEDIKIEISGSKIQHFIHHHSLNLFSFEEEFRPDKVCDGCMKRLSGPSYGCEECDFFVHKEFLELPRKKRNFLHQYRLNLISISNFVFQCKTCLNYFNGFAYHCKTCLSTFDTQCTLIKILFKHPAHQHPLSRLHK
ncbi:uncharacterized protein LOC120084832, partial [Benincasa hispida]|uniref:uncharacterized protein LOC120084832 n=1 Tax=Benincasa hispida TaxID=102211 RepID=UPI001900ACE4